MKKRRLQGIATEELLHWLEGCKRFYAAETHPAARRSRARQMQTIARELVRRGVTELPTKTLDEKLPLDV